LVTVTVCSLTVRPWSSMCTLHVQPSGFEVAVTLMARVTAQLWA
jgi:hypothetical protein